MSPQLTEQQRKALLFTQGKLKSWCLPHQHDLYDAFQDWNERRQTKPYRRLIKARKAKYDNCFVLEAGRKYGKTGAALVLGVQEAIRRPGSKGMIATPFANSIATIVVPLINEIFADAPEGYRPEHLTTNVETGDHHSLYIPATKSSIRLRGLDLHTKALRGPWLDWLIVTEAAFCNDLGGVLRSEIYPMMQKRPWAWILLESSTAKEKDHPFNTEFREDAELRTGDDLGTAYKKYTIRDNTRLSEDEIELEVQRSGGPEHPTALRELFCIQVRDDQDAVIPEFDESTHCVARPPRPQHAYALVGMDPGRRDPFGLVFGYLDFERQVFVIEVAFGGHRMCNRGTTELAQIIKETEQTLWGAKHREAGEGFSMTEIMGAVYTGDNRCWESPEAAFTYWDHNTWGFKPNPMVRVSDVEVSTQIDMHADHDLIIATAEKKKGSKDADLAHLSTLFATGRIEIIECEPDCPHKMCCLPLIQQLRSGVWNKTRTDYARTPTLGHLDSVMALKYMARRIPWTARAPFPPRLRDPNAPDIHMPEHMKRRAQEGNRIQLPKVLGGRQPLGKFR